MTRKFISINWLRCIACFLIVNSHISGLYPAKLSVLSFGGFFGNCIFFFVSAFCLFQPHDSFFRWYGKRFVRIYLSYLLVLPFLFLVGSLEGLTWYQVLIPYKNYHFLPTILMLYPLLYCMSYVDRKKWLNIKWQILILFGLQLAEYLVFFDYNHVSVTQHFVFPEILAYALMMGFGAAARKRINEGDRQSKHSLLVISSLAILSLLTYVYQNLWPFSGIFSILQLYTGIAFSVTFCLLVIALEEKLPNWNIVDLISSATLEVYLVHFIIITPFSSISFPTGIVFFMISAIAIAHCFHIIGDLINKMICDHLFKSRKSVIPKHK